MKQGTEECDRVARSARSECGAAIDRCISHISRLRDIAYVAAAAAAAAVGRVSSENLRLLIRKVSQSVSQSTLVIQLIYLHDDDDGGHGHRHCHCNDPIRAASESVNRVAVQRRIWRRRTRRRCTRDSENLGLSAPARPVPPRRVLVGRPLLSKIDRKGRRRRRRRRIWCGSGQPRGLSCPAVLPVVVVDVFHLRSINYFTILPLPSCLLSCLIV